MDLIARYIYAVTKELPEKQREDISQELRTLIDDMIDQIQGDKKQEEKIKEVLKSLGDPKELARKYRGSDRYLIGPNRFDDYLMVLKIVSLGIFIGVTVSVILGGVFPSVEVTDISLIDIIGIITSYIGSVFVGLLQGFAGVTILFGLAEYYKSAETVSENDWNLSDLPEIPQKEAKISKTDSVISIIFTTIFMYILIFNADLLALYSRSSETITITPVFNYDALYNFRLLLVIIFLLNISKEVIKMIWGSWKVNLAVITSFIVITSMTITLYVLSRPDIWNANFPEELSKRANLGIQPIAVLLTIVFVGAVAEIGIAAYKGIRYNNIKG